MIYDASGIAIYNGNCLDVMRQISDNQVDMTLTSPPYDNLRDYEGITWNENVWKAVIRELYRVTKQGGVVVWIVGDATINGSETGTSFKQALWAMECWFRLHDTMIWNKGGFSAVGALSTRYAPVFEYMFIWSKGKPKAFNPIKDHKTKHGGKSVTGTVRQSNGTTKAMSKVMTINEYAQRFNIWDQSPQRQSGKCHPAPFPYQLAYDHILSWSNPDDTILDPFAGSGTTLVAARDLGRKAIGIDLSRNYCGIAVERLAA